MSHLAEYLKTKGISAEDMPDALRAAQQDFGTKGQKSARWGSQTEGKVFTVAECNCEGRTSERTGKVPNWADGSHVGNSVLFAHVPAGGHAGRYHVGGFVYLPSVYDVDAKVEKLHALIPVPYTIFAKCHELAELGTWADGVPIIGS